MDTLRSSPLSRRPVLAATMVCAGCPYQVVRTLVPADRMPTLDGRSRYLKAHLRNGYVYVLSDWRADSGGAALYGHGQLLDANRAIVAEGDFRLRTDSVALFETNVVHGSGANTALTVVTGVTAVIAGICAANPKTCFGSCPTFYAPDSSGESLQAEGFSSSIAPALEATDVDMLYRARPRGRDFMLRVTNEALETHVIRRANVLALRRPAGGRVFVTPDGVFRAASYITPPSSCLSSGGDCLSAVAALDGRERSSPADSSDLATREVIDLEVDDVPAGQLGLVVGSRQTLMTTYLIYQALAYMGSQAATWLSALETGGPALREGAGRLGPGAGTNRRARGRPRPRRHVVARGECGGNRPDRGRHEGRAPAGGAGAASAGAAATHARPLAPRLRGTRRPQRHAHAAPHPSRTGPPCRTRQS